MTVKIDLTKFENVATGIAGAIPDALYAACLVGEGKVKQICPVRTGHLRDSYITTPAVSGSGVATVRCETNVPYAKYVEFGWGQRPKPHLRTGFLNNKNEIANAFANALGKKFL